MIITEAGNHGSARAQAVGTASQFARTREFTPDSSEASILKQQVVALSRQWRYCRWGAGDVLSGYLECPKRNRRLEPRHVLHHGWWRPHD